MVLMFRVDVSTYSSKWSVSRPSSASKSKERRTGLATSTFNEPACRAFSEEIASTMLPLVSVTAAAVMER